MENDPDFIEDPRQGRGNVKYKNDSVAILTFFIRHFDL